ncbi:SMP-30/gluconolactonase/LRE family protein [Mycolicibacterium novocastrense]|nr:SMP-30/gluconolactonase/LRE family protein [Mycolicibacterium novocastrense]
MDVDRLTDSIASHGEGPVWSPTWGGLRWVDMTAGEVLSFADDGSVTRTRVGTIAAALRPRRGGGAVIAVERGFLLEEPDGSTVPLPPVWSDPTVRMNEGGCAPDGSFYCGSMAYDKRAGAGALYRLAADGTVTVVLTGVTVSNGLDWSPDDQLAYYNDTDTHRVDVFSWNEDIGLHDRRSFVEIPNDGRPDGLTVDAEGGVWTALSGGGAVHRYTPDGRLDAVITLPTPKVTACAFGGDDLGTLFITTSREGLAPGEDPLAGSLFSTRPGVTGRPVRQYAG